MKNVLDIKSVYPLHSYVQAMWMVYGTTKLDAISSVKHMKCDATVTKEKQKKNKKK